MSRVAAAEPEEWFDGNPEPQGGLDAFWDEVDAAYDRLKEDW